MGQEKVVAAPTVLTRLDTKDTVAWRGATRKPEKGMRSRQDDILNFDWLSGDAAPDWDTPVWTWERNAGRVLPVDVRMAKGGKGNFNFRILCFRD